MSEEIEKKDTLTARFDAEIRVGLFLNVNRGGSHPPPTHHKKKIIKISENTEDEREIEIRGDTSLTRSHLFVFLALCKLAGENGLDKISDGDPILESMRGQGQFARSALKISKLSLRKIAKKAGRSTGGKALDDLMEIIRDLASVTIFVRFNIEGKKREYGSALIGFYRDDDNISVSFHSFLSIAILGVRYSSLTWSEFEQLNDDTARFLLSILSSRIRPGKKVRISESTILDDCYGQIEVSPRARRDRIKSIREALLKIAETGWTIEKSGVSSYFFTRPKVL